MVPICSINIKIFNLVLMIRFSGISNLSPVSHLEPANLCQIAPINVTFDLFQFDADYTADILKDKVCYFIYYMFMKDYFDRIT